MPTNPAPLPPRWFDRPAPEVARDLIGRFLILRGAAAEMSERIEACCGLPIAARTFHALAYEIIGAVEGEKPPFARTTTDDGVFLSLIRDILREIVARLSDVAETVIGWFAGFCGVFPYKPTGLKSIVDKDLV